jgi:hypothetical protein
MQCVFLNLARIAFCLSSLPCVLSYVDSNTTFCALLNSSTQRKGPGFIIVQIRILWATVQMLGKEILCSIIVECMQKFDSIVSFTL